MRERLASPLVVPFAVARPERVVAALFLLLGGAQMAALLRHAPWGDELQAVLLAHHAHSLSDWYWNFRYEGHPPLWHMLLKAPLALGVAPERALKLVLAPFVLANLWLVWRAPLRPALRFAVALNYYLVFEYGVIARPYTMGVAFLLAGVTFRRRAFGWIFVALMPACGLQFVLLAGICGWLLWREGNRPVAGLAAVVVSALLALVWIWPAPDFEASLSIGVLLRDHVESFFASIMRAGFLLTPLDWTGAALQWSQLTLEARVMLFVAGLAAPFVAIGCVRTRPSFALAMTGFVLFTLALSIFSYVLSARHFGLVFVLALAFVMVQQAEEGRVSRIFTVWAVLLAAQGGVALARSFTQDFGPSARVASFIAASAEREAVFIPLEAGLGNEISLVTGRPTFDLGHGCWQAFPQTRAPAFRKQLRQMAGPDALETEAGSRALLGLLKAAASGLGGRVLVLADVYPHEMLARVADPNLRLVAALEAEDPRSPFGRWVYEMRAPAAPRDWPDCRATAGR